MQYDVLYRPICIRDVSKRNAEQGVVEQPVNEHSCVDSDKPIPKRAAWHTFLLDSENKQQFFLNISVKK